jgi:hypothetical protein
MWRGRDVCVCVRACVRVCGQAGHTQDRTGQDRTGQDRTGQDRTGQTHHVIVGLFNVGERHVDLG